MLRIIRNRIKLQNWLRNAILICVVAMIALGIAHSLIDTYAYDRYYEQREVARAELDAIAAAIEFGGLDEAVQQQMQDYVGKYSQFANFIVIDDEFRVLHSLNQGHLDDSGYFYACIGAQEDSSMLSVLDAQGDLVNRFPYETDTPFALANLSRPLYGKLKQAIEPGTDDPETGGRYDQSAQVYAVIDSGTYAIDLSHVSDGNGSQRAQYYGIPTKNVHMFYIGESIDSGYWEQSQRQYASMRNAAEAMSVALVLMFMGYWLMTAVWVFMDASRRGNHPALWSVLALCTNAVGLIVYLVVRPEERLCADCKYPVDKQHLVCPICGARNREQCAHCGKIVEEAWNICPYCTKPIQRGDSEVGEVSAD